MRMTVDQHQATFSVGLFLLPANQLPAAKTRLRDVELLYSSTLLPSSHFLGRVNWPLYILFYILTPLTLSIMAAIR